MTTESTPDYLLKFNPIALSHFIVIHGMALFAFFPFAFSWSAVALMFFMYWLTASIGICLGYHRYFNSPRFYST